MNIGGGANLYRVELSEEGSNPKTWLYAKNVVAGDASEACVKALAWARQAHHATKLAIYKVEYRGAVL
jgi:hypothetical protein